MNRSESIKELATALSKAQSVMKGAIKSSENPYFHSTYADLSSVWDACRKPLTDNGLSVIQSTIIVDGKLILETVLLHTSGEWCSSSYPINPMKQLRNEGWTPSEDPQSMGSALSYGRRYTLAAITGTATEDDDGNAATGKDTTGKDTKKKPEPQKSYPPPTGTITVKVDSVTKKEFTKDGKPAGEKYTVHVGDVKYVTFNSTFAADASKAAKAGLPVEIEFKSTSYGPEIVRLTVHSVDQPSPPMGEPDPPLDDTAQDGYPTAEEERAELEQRGMIPKKGEKPEYDMAAFEATLKAKTDTKSLDAWYILEKKKMPAEYVAKTAKLVMDRKDELKKK